MSDVSANASAPAANASKNNAKRPGRPPKRSADAAKLDTDSAATTPVIAAVAAAAPVTNDAAPKKKAGRKPKTADAAAAAPVVAAAPPAVPIAGGAGESDISTSVEPTKKKVTPTYIVGYGDEDKSFEEQLAAVTQEDFFNYRNKYFEKLNKITYSQWAKEKTANVKAAARKEASASKRSKRTKKTVDYAAQYEAIKAKLSALNPTVFASLNGKWITDFGKFGIINASELTGKNPLELPQKALHAATVYELAIKNGATPAGIVDCNRSLKPGAKKADKDYLFVTTCPGERLFVGEMPKYYKEPLPGVQECVELSKTTLNKKAVEA